MQLKLVPAIGVNFYAIPEMREYFEQSVNDATPFPEHLSRVLAKQKSESTNLNSVSDKSDTPSTSNVIPIFDR